MTAPVVTRFLWAVFAALGSVFAPEMPLPPRQSVADALREDWEYVLGPAETWEDLR